MTVLDWLTEKFSHRPPQVDHFDKAMHVTQEVEAMARELRRKIEPYKVGDDPFISMFLALYEQNNNDGTARVIHLGPNGGNGNGRGRQG